MLFIRTGKLLDPATEKDLPPEESSKHTELLNAIEQNTAATAAAVSSIPIPEAVPPVDLLPVIEALQNIKQEQPQVLEWHFEIKRDSLKLITDVIARAVKT